MFGRSKYEYTCPDVIQLRAVAKRRNRNIIVGNLLSGVALIAAGHALEKYQNRQIDRLIDEAEAEANK